MSEIPRLGGVMVSGSRQITDFHYPNMRFPVAEGTEWPKWVHTPGYPDQIAGDAEEEAVLLARPPCAPIPVKPRRIVVSQPVIMQNSVQVIPEPVQTPIPPIPDVWWRNALMWLSRKLEALARI